jgi:hypothetical protein
MRFWPGLPGRLSILRRRSEPPPAPIRSTSPTGRGDGLRIRAVAVRIRRGAPDPQRPLGSAVERLFYTQDVGRSIRSARTNHPYPLVAQWQSNRLISDRRMFDSSREDQRTSRWIRSVKPEWRWSGFLTRAPVVRNHSDPPSTDLCPQRPRERILNPSRKHRRFESDQVRHIQFGAWPGRAQQWLRYASGCEMDSGFSPAGCPGMTEDNP